MEVSPGRIAQSIKYMKICCQSSIAVARKPLIVFRVTFRHDLMESFDKGVHWKRVSLSYIIVPKDLILFEWKGNEYVIVAIGKQGILRRKLPDGEWNREEVLGAGEELFFTSNILAALGVVKGEIIIWLGVAFLALLITHVSIWDRLEKDKSIGNLKKWLMQSGKVAIIFIMLEATIAYLVIGLAFISPSFFLSWSDNQWILFYTLSIGLAVFSPFAWLLMETDKWIMKETPDRAVRSIMVFFCALTTISVFLIGVLPLPFWALGIIERYQWALALSISISIFITALGYFLIHRIQINGS